MDLLSLSVTDFAAATAAKQPTPGGGSVAGAVGMLGVALGEMALAFTAGKKKYAAHAEYHEHAAKRLAKAREMFRLLVADDVAAFGEYQEASRLEEGPARQEAMQLAIAAAIDVPREASKLALAVLEDLLALADKTSPYLVSDLVAAAALMEPVCRLSDYNVRINVPNVSDASAAAEVKQSSANDLARAVALRQQIEAAVAKHLP